jgi:heat shock protein HslJ
MNTDDDADYAMDARLQQAGDRWRTANMTVAAVDLHAATAVEADVRTTGTTEVPLVHETQTPRRRKRIWVGAAASLAAAVALGFGIAQLAGHGTSHPDRVSSEISIAGINWQLVRLTDANGATTKPARPATLFIDLESGHGQLRGSDGCNALGAPVTADAAGRLHVGDLTSTAMGCPGTNVGAESARVVGVLSGDAKYSINGGELTISKAGAGSLRYTAASADTPSSDPTDLYGISWTLDTIEKGKGPTGTASSASSYANVTVQFERRGRMEGANGCNGYGSQVSVSSGTIAIGLVTETTEACPSGIPGLVSTDATVFGRILSGHVAWSISGDQLTITKAGVGSLVFQATDIDPGFTGSSAPGLPSSTPTK